MSQSGAAERRVELQFQVGKVLPYLLLTAMAEGKAGKGRDEDASCALHLRVCHLGFFIDVPYMSVDRTFRLPKKK